MELKGFFRIGVHRCLKAYSVLTKPEPGVIILDENKRVEDMKLEKDDANLHEVQNRCNRNDKCTGRITFQKEIDSKIFEVVQGFQLEL